MSDISERLEKIQRAMKAAEAAAAKYAVIVESATEAFEKAMAELKEKFDVETIEEAKALDAKLNKKIEAALVKVEKSLEDD